MTSSGGVGGSGVTASYHATVFNDGRIGGAGPSATGIVFANGGMLVNGSAAYVYALVQGHADAVLMSGAGSVVNFGTIRGVGEVYGGSAGVVLDDGGAVTNGANRDTRALISGYTAVSIAGAGSRPR